MTAPLIALLVASALLVLCCILLRRVDSVISGIYTHDRQRWVDLGSPTGFFWRPKEKVPFFASTGARNAVAVTALLSPEELVRERRPSER